MSQDWPYLQKYEALNQELKKTENNGDRIVFLGDSITEFWSVHLPEFFTKNPYHNRGISGQTSPQILLRFRADVIELKPKKVVILAGVNDIAGNTGYASLQMICNNLYSMIELAHVHQIQVVLCSILPANFLPWKTKENPSQKIKELNQILSNYAQKNNIQFVNYYPHMVDQNDGMLANYTDDGVHPNKNGYQIMTNIITQALAEN